MASKKNKPVPNDKLIELIHKFFNEIIQEYGFFEFDGSQFNSNLPYLTDMVGQMERSNIFQSLLK